MRALYDSEVSDFLSSDIGLEQGDPSSPLMFMFFVKDITQNINSDLDDVITIDDVKLFLRRTRPQARSELSHLHMGFRWLHSRNVS